MIDQVIVAKIENQSSIRNPICLGAEEFNNLRDFVQEVIQTASEIEGLSPKKFTTDVVGRYHLFAIDDMLNIIGLTDVDKEVIYGKALFDRINLIVNSPIGSY